IGVGGHCLPKDGVLLWWRRLEQGADSSRSIILESRRINDAAPAEVCRAMERAWGSLAGRQIALLGVAYRFDSEDTRNSPTLALGRLLRERGAKVRLHDPFVQPRDQNLVRSGLADRFTNELGTALADADLVVLCTAHRVYLDNLTDILRAAPRLQALFDGANAWHRDDFSGLNIQYCGIGRGRQAPPPELVAAVLSGFRAVERGVANELAALIEFFNDQYAEDDFNRVEFETVQRLAGTCVTGCRIADPGPVAATLPFSGFEPHLAMVALQSDESAGTPA
ncbi:MAG TPA: UDP binding domain-containing protein, partial [Gemmatimonadales bacterium]|nr:UDP binding domain-containing protein [Gemmatimonadales bacterium]